MGCWKTFNKYVTIEPMVFFYYVSVFLVATGWQEFFYQKLCRNKYNFNETDCTDSTFQHDHPDIQADTSNWMIYTNVVLIIPLLFCLTFLSGYSDKHGIRLALVLPFAGSVLSCIWTVLNSIYFSWPAELAFISTFITGAVGFYSSVLMASMTYVVLDCTETPHLLPLRIALIEMAASLGGLVGYLVVGPILQYAGLTTLFVIMGVCQLLGLLDIVLRLRRPEHNVEALASTRQLCSDLFSFASVREYGRVLFRKRDRSKRAHLHIVTLAFMFVFSSYTGLTDIQFLFITKQWGYSALFYSLQSGLCSLFSVIGATVVMYYVSQKLQLQPTTYMVIGGLATAVGSGLQAYGGSVTLLWLSAIPKLFITYTATGARLYIVDSVDKGEVAAAMGYVASAQSFFALLASILFNGIYPLTLSSWPGLMFMVAGFMSMVTVPMATFVMYRDSSLQ